MILFTYLLVDVNKFECVQNGTAIEYIFAGRLYAATQQQTEHVLALLEY